MSFVGSYVWKLRQALGSQRILVAGVGLFVVNAEGKIWLGKRVDSSEWACFGGAMELGDSVIDTACKELHEETGINVGPENWTYIGVHTNPQEVVYAYPNGDEVQIVNHLFLTRYDGLMDNGEDVEHTEFSLFALDALPSPMKPDVMHEIRMLKAFLQTGKVQVN